MASYNPPGKEVAEWTTVPKPPTHTPRDPYPASRSGSTRDYDRPWSGDNESRPGTMSRVASSLQSNIGNYLLFRAVMPQQQQGLQQVHADDLDPAGQAAVGNAARSLLGGPPPGPGGGGNQGPPGLGQPPAGPPKALGPGPGAALNQEEMGQGSLFGRSAFTGAIPMPPRKEDRRPRGRSQRGKDRFPQQSFDI